MSEVKRLKKKLSEKEIISFIRSYKGDPNLGGVSIDPKLKKWELDQIKKYGFCFEIRRGCKNKKCDCAELAWYVPFETSDRFNAYWVSSWKFN